MSFWNQLFGRSSKETLPSITKTPPSQPPSAAQPSPASSKAPTPSTANCDICNQAIRHCDGYMLTTKQVVTEMAYWQRFFWNQGKKLLVGNPATETRLINGFAKKQAASATGWLVCEQCSPMFVFNRAVAKQCAASGTQPPDCGPVDASEVMTKAIYARKMLEG